VFWLIPLGSLFNPRNSVFIRNKKAGHDVRPIADLNDIRSITQTELKNEKRTNNRNSSGNNRTARLFDSRISRYAWDTLLYRLSVDSTRQTKGVPGAAREISRAALRIGQTPKHCRIKKQLRMAASNF
jgi:hypothetical protein